MSTRPGKNGPTCQLVTCIQFLQRLFIRCFAIVKLTYCIRGVEWMMYIARGYFGGDDCSERSMLTT